MVWISKLQAAEAAAGAPREAEATYHEAASSLELQADHFPMSYVKARLNTVVCIYNPGLQGRAVSPRFEEQLVPSSSISHLTHHQKKKKGRSALLLRKGTHSIFEKHLCTSIGGLPA